MPIPHLEKKVLSPQAWKTNRSDFRPRRKKKSPKNKKNFDIKRLKRKKSFKFKNLLKKSKKIIPGLIICSLAGLIALIGALAWLAKDLPKPDKLITRDVAQSTKIYDRSGEHLLYEIHGEEQRTIIRLEGVPAYVIQATLALEDQRFYEHKGFSLWGIFRGVVLQTLKGQRAQGGSTLTQQLVKNAILTDERSITRKIKELILSYQIEKKYSKQEILQMFFNEIPYGSTAYGIEAAANYYLGKNAKNLTLAEAALLAALPQRPSYFSPNGSHVNELFARQQYALSQMVKLGNITAAEAEAAKNEEIKFKQKIESVTAPHFVFYVKELLSEKYGEKMVEQGGLKIISTLDYDLQKKAEEIIAAQAEKNLENYDATNAALVTIDVKTGQILAMVGSKDFFNEEIDGQVNVALSPRQPGSSFKPIVYTAAWQRGYVPETVVYDLETVFPVVNDNDYIPHNYDLKERGPVSLRSALAGSLNIPAVKMIYLTGIDNVLNLADSLGYTTLKDRSRFGLSLVLGGGEVKLLEHVNAFAVLARDGKFLPTTPLLKLEGGDGRLMEEFKESRPAKVMEPNIARITDDVLSDNNARAFIFGANNYLTLPDRAVAAKTGTTNDYHDAWTIGFTPNVATGVWVGNNNNDEMKRGADGSVVAAPIWQQVMKEATKNYPAEEFLKPSYNIPDKPMLGGEASGLKVKIDKMSGLLATEFTPLQLVEEKIFKQAHSLLYYVDKDDPLGAPPTNPDDDEYFKYWEEAVAKWAAKEGVINQPPPTAEDNLHQPGDRPQVNFISPENNITQTNERITLDVRASAPRGVNKIEYYLDGQLLHSIFQEPYLFNYNLPYAYLNGPHQFTVKAYDDLGNVNEDLRNINLDRQAYLNIGWLQPDTGATITATDFPYNLIIHLDKAELVKKIDFYFRLAGSNNSQWIGYVNDVFDNTNQVVWSSPPEPGTYKVYPIITDALNAVVTGPEITVSIE